MLEPPLGFSDRVSVCMLSHGNWEETARALQSALRFGLRVHLGVTAAATPPFACTGVTVHHLTWAADFARARNDLLARLPADGTHVLWMDSDEILFAFPDLDWSTLRSSRYAVALQFDAASTPGLGTRGHRLLPSVRWQGAIHEELVDSRTAAPPVPLHGVLLVHTGYDDPTVLPGKHRRNLALALPALDHEVPHYGALLTQARAASADGRGHILHWLACYRAAAARNASGEHLLDARAEPAEMLCTCGYLGPALHVLSQNPLLLRLQLAVLSAQYGRHGAYDADRFAFTARCLRHGYGDARYPLPRHLLGATAEELDHHVRASAPPSPRPHPTAPHLPEMRPSMERYQQADDVEQETFEDDLILMHRRTLRAVALNPTAAVLWEALAWQMSAADLLDLLTSAFPDQPRDALETALHETLALLDDHDLIVARAPAPVTSGPT